MEEEWIVIIYIYELQATLQKRISIIVVKKYRLT